MSDTESRGGKDLLTSTWQIESDRRYLLLSRVSIKGQRFTESVLAEKIAPGQTPILGEDLEDIFDPDSKTEVTPYTLKVFNLKTSVEAAWGSSIIKEIKVGIKDSTSVVYVYMVFNLLGQEYSHQYFFDAKGNPAGFLAPGVGMPHWPSQKPGVLTDEMLKYFSSLSEANPEFSESLSNSVAKLVKTPTEK